MRWKLVPVDPTEGMVNAAEDYMEFIDTTWEVWDAMLTAAPPASQDEELVEKVAHIIGLHAIGEENTKEGTEKWEFPFAEPIARAVIRMLEGSE